MIIGTHSEQPIIRPLQSSFSDAGNKRFMSIERKLITIANKDIDKGKIDRDFGDVVETNLSVVIEYSVIGILRYDDFLVVDSQAVHADQGLQFVGHATAGLGAVLSSLCHIAFVLQSNKYHTKRRESTLNTGIEVQPSTYPLDR